MNNNTFVHKYINNLINNNDTVVDMTAGNGNDTLFLCSKAKKVFAFDIQDQAIINTRERCINYNNLELIKDTHSNVDLYVKDKIKLFIFNLGYLPYSDFNIITKADETLIAFKKAYNLCSDDGYIVITFYIGHQGGKEEYYKLLKYITDNKLNILTTYRENKKADEPITLIIKKRP